MPTKRRSTRGKSGVLLEEEAIVSTPPTRSSRRATESAAAIWSGSPSPLSSISTPASSSAIHARRLGTGRCGVIAETNLDDDDDDSGGSGSEGNADSVDELLSKAAEVIRDEVIRNDDGAGVAQSESESEARETKRQRSNSPAARGAKAGGRGGWWPGKRGRPPKSAAGLQRQYKQKQRKPEEEVDEEEAEEEDEGVDDPAVDADRAGDDAAADGTSEDSIDAAGEAKITRNGELLGGREFICPVFQSPFRGNGKQMYVLSMDCCRFTGARDSYMLFKQHPRMKRVETTQKERDLLAERNMIPRVTRFRPIAMIMAYQAFREFGARLIKGGGYIVDDYWEAATRAEAKFPEGTLVANMSVYRTVMAAAAAGMAPGSTRVSRRSQLPRSPSGGGVSADQQLLLSPMQNPSNSAVSSWVQLEAQQPMKPSIASQRTMASALMLAPQLLGEANGAGVGVPNDSIQSQSSAKPIFRRMRAAETAEAAFESAASAHRAYFDDSGFVDGAPLAHSLASSWTRAPSLTNRLKQQMQPNHNQPDDGGAFGPMAFASGRVARDFNALVRMWRDDNGCTWVDPHTGIRQVPAALQPTSAFAQRVASTGSSTDSRVAFADSQSDMPEPVHEPYPLAVLPGQYQASFPVHRTRFGQTQQGAMNSYSYHWMRQLANLHQAKMSHQQQHQQQMLMMQNMSRKR
ncbi:chromatin structure-remodeling complex subunit RSC7 [Coemansia aciculifera]|uniref:Chromatin structure-remodeling complex subunit RSC7 n=1 Tax=Coemansia aciculifera TaxID=417176 RepID=A0ACC1M2V3_9FUNG|nr:chromatin structure-remodeling complex subunit RSC7 [Coemansia aciculifera]